MLVATASTDDVEPEIEVFEDTRIYRVTLDHFPEGADRSLRETIGVMVDKGDDLDGVMDLLVERYGEDVRVIEATIVLEGDVLANSEYAIGDL
jgi:hypothetical protein